jgi:uncharacterized protein
MDSILINGQNIPTLVAITDDEQEKGLMFEDKPVVMSFPFEKEAVRKFWMSNTFIPLDIIFCCAGRIVDICYGEPMSETFVGPNSPTDLVVELPYGYAKKIGATIGSPIDIKLSIKTKLKKLLANIQQ